MGTLFIALSLSLSLQLFSSLLWEFPPAFSLPALWMIAFTSFVSCLSKISLRHLRSSVSKYCFVYFVCVLVVSGRRANLVSVVQSWLEAEVMPFYCT